MNQHLLHTRPRVTEEPLSPRALIYASRRFCRAVRELNASSRFVHDQIRDHMGVL